MFNHNYNHNKLSSTCLFIDQQRLKDSLIAQSKMKERKTLCGKAQEEFVSLEGFDGRSQLVSQQRLPLSGRQVIHLPDTIITADGPQSQSGLQRLGWTLPDCRPSFPLSARPLVRCLPHRYPFSPPLPPLPPHLPPLRHPPRLTFDFDDLCSTKHAFAN